MKHVLVLMGGFSKEREISKISGNAVISSLRKLGYVTSSIDPVNNLIKEIEEIKPDIIFNALHGKFGEDGTIQGILEILKIPYTHSGVLSSALAMNKFLSKKILTQSGINCTEGRIYSINDLINNSFDDFPYVIKPINEGSSFGVNIVFNIEDFKKLTTKEWVFGDQVLVEKFVPGREITVGVLNNKALAVTEIKSKKVFYDYESKYNEKESEHLIPAPLPSNKYKEAMDISLKAHKILGCKSISRSDIRYDDSSGDGKFYLMEVNTQPGFTPNSLVPEQAAYLGISFEEVIKFLIEDAGLDR